MKNKSYQMKDSIAFHKRLKFDPYKTNETVYNVMDTSIKINNSESHIPILLSLEPQWSIDDLSNKKLKQSYTDINFNIHVSITCNTNNNEESRFEHLEDLYGQNNDGINLSFESASDFKSSKTDGISLLSTSTSLSPISLQLSCSDKSICRIIDDSLDDGCKDLSMIVDKQNFENTELIRKKELMKSNLRRQLLSNPYYDICKNPEWPFVKRRSRAISRSSKGSDLSYKKDYTQRVKSSGQKTTIEGSKTVKGRSRQWLESLATLFDGIYTQRSSLGRSAGLGLFSDRHFNRNEIITEFVGWVIDRNEALRLRSERKASHICDLIKPSLYLDGEKDPKPFIGGGSFANDGSTSLGGPGNNARFWKWYDEREGRTRVFLKALQDIYPKEEIFVGYCKDYWVDVAEEDVKPKLQNTKKISNLKALHDAHIVKDKRTHKKDFTKGNIRIKTQKYKKVSNISEVIEDHMTPNKQDKEETRFSKDKVTIVNSKKRIKSSKFQQHKTSEIAEANNTIDLQSNNTDSVSSSLWNVDFNWETSDDE
ncbi:hypothetical protein cand_035220 [Cryptosporidium andersoni]|uniref:SET domain-containing protein n=1 Tax=Cryptosporidium andersoni TaxID=117008 RepID=A0A1J4MV98_9CRYT|nr:hypothetical protein cand_035220 [Cryptosporidium andersoni]